MSYLEKVSRGIGAIRNVFSAMNSKGEVCLTTGQGLHAKNTRGIR